MEWTCHNGSTNRKQQQAVKSKKMLFITFLICRSYQFWGKIESIFNSILLPSNAFESCWKQYIQFIKTKIDKYQN